MDILASVGTDELAEAFNDDAAHLVETLWALDGLLDDEDAWHGWMLSFAAVVDNLHPDGQSQVIRMLDGMHDAVVMRLGRAQ